MKTIKLKLNILYILTGLIILNVNFALAQDEAVIKAFSKSYTSEAIPDYAQAIKDLQDVYSADSYELNLRLGWLNYKAGNNDESMKYYQIAIDLMPYSFEAKLGYNLPASAAELWDKVIENYKDILKIYLLRQTGLHHGELSF